MCQIIFFFKKIHNVAKFWEVTLYCFCFLFSDNLLLPLLQMEKGEDVNVKQVLLNMRKYRMGLIQTPDQLRFSYMAIIEGAKYTQGDSNIQVNHCHYYQITRLHVHPHPFLTQFGLVGQALCMSWIYKAFQHSIGREESQLLRAQGQPDTLYWDPDFFF